MRDVVVRHDIPLYLGIYPPQEEYVVVYTVVYTVLCTLHVAVP